MADNPFAAGGSSGGATPDNPFATGSSTPSTSAAHHGGFLHGLGNVAKTGLDVVTLGASGATSLGPGYAPHVLSAPAHVGANLLKDVGTYGAGVAPGLYELGKAYYLDNRDLFEGKQTDDRLLGIAKNAAEQEKAYYTSNLGHNLYEHPLTPILDALTVASGGAGAAAKLGKAAEAAGLVADDSRLARLGDRATLETRSPSAIATGEGPVHTDLSSAQPFVRAREQLANNLRSARTELANNHPRLAAVANRGGELKAFGKQVQSKANLNALENLAGFQSYAKATRGLSQDEWGALHVRALDIHPDDLAELWKGTPNEAVAASPKVRSLALNPTPKLMRAEDAARSLSAQGEQLFKESGKLTDETADARPDLTKRQAAEVLGRDVQGITDDPYYFPHAIEPGRAPNPLQSAGGGKGVPTRLGSMKQNSGALALSGKLHLRGDVLGPEFLRRVKYVKYDEIHNALLRGAVKVTRDQINHYPEGRLPKGWEYVRERASTRTPPTIRGEGDTHVPLNKLIPDAESLHDSQLAKDGFATSDERQAHTDDGETYHIIPKSTVKAATGEFTRSSDFTHNFIQRPLSVWRAAVLGLRPGFLTNNLVGNSLMYAVKTGGQGAIRDLFRAIVESHGRDTALRLLKDSATPDGVRTDLYKEFFPDQVHGTFGRTQSPSTSLAHAAGKKSVEVGRAVTGAIPNATSKIAEEYPRRALIRHYIRHSPEFRKVYRALPKDTRTFETAARRLLKGEGGAEYQRYISKRVNQALGDYLNMSSVERNVIRNILPFYTWYRAITTTTAHLALDNPLRANILTQIGKVGDEDSKSLLGSVPSFLDDSIGLGGGANGTKRVLATAGLNPYSTLDQLRTGAMDDVTSLGLNPFLVGATEAFATATGDHKHISPAEVAAKMLQAMGVSLPAAQVISPSPPSQLYPNRNRNSTLLSYFGVPVKEYDPAVAASQAAEGK